MYLLISVLILFISYYLFKKASGTLDIRQLNISSFVFYSLFLMTFIGSLQIQYDLLIPESYVPQDDNLRTHGWMVVMYAMIMVPIGMLIACWLFRVGSMRNLVHQYYVTPLDFKDIFWESCFKHSQYIFSLLSIIAVSFIIYMQIENIPLFHLLGGSQDYYGMGMLRHDSGLRNFEYGRLLNIVLSPIAAFSSVFAYSAYGYFKAKKRIIDLLWLVVMVFFSLLLNTYALVKSSIIYWAISLIVVHIIVVGKLSIKGLAGTVAVIICLIGLSTIFVQGSRAYIESVNLLSVVSISVDVFVSRITWGQLFGTYLCLDIFPGTLPHIFFSSTGNFIHQLFNMPFSPDYGMLVMSVWRPNWPPAGHCTTYFMGEAWANFGLIGIILAPLFVGFIIQTFHIGLLRLRKTAFNVAIYGFSFSVMPIMSGLKGFYYPEGFIEYFIVIVMIYAVAVIIHGSVKSIRIKDPVKIISIL